MSASEIREQLHRVIEILRPYANSTGKFHNSADVRVAISLAQVALERAAHLAAKQP